MHRIPEQVGGRLLLDDLAGVHHQDPVREVEHGADVVADEQHREALLGLQAPDVLQDLVLHHHVEAGGRFVEQHESWLVGQRQGEIDPLAHAAGQLVRDRR